MKILYSILLAFMCIALQLNTAAMRSRGVFAGARAGAGQQLHATSIHKPIYNTHKTGYKPDYKPGYNYGRRSVYAPVYVGYPDYSYPDYQTTGTSSERLGIDPDSTSESYQDQAYPQDYSNYPDAGYQEDQDYQERQAYQPYYPGDQNQGSNTTWSGY